MSDYRTDDESMPAIDPRVVGPPPERRAPDRIAFRHAAEDALARAPCWGEGAVYWAVASLQRAFFDPPSASRLKSGPPPERGNTRRANEVSS